MKLCFNDILNAFSFALDCVEHDLVGVTTHHSNRVAYICLLMGKRYGLKDKELLDLVTCALLHDNALTEYIQEEYIEGKDVINNKDNMNIGTHCRIGERNIRNIPFHTDVKGVILYHHENADGSGPFGKKENETPIFAQLIHIADILDTEFDFSIIEKMKYEVIIDYVKISTGILFSKESAELFINNISYDVLENIQGDKGELILSENVPIIYEDYTSEQIKKFCNLFANIIDYKSKFTMHHSIGVAKKAEIMAKHFGFDEDTVTKLYFAGAVHDIGKLVIDRDILEKKDKLTDIEYNYIQNHAYYTYNILRKIKGLKDVTKWASLHHEKLDGSGYPFGKIGRDLKFNERLMCCIDIYQALTEKRPYKDGLSHEKSIEILSDMADKGLVDSYIVSEIDKVFSKKTYNKNYVMAQ